MEKQTAVEFIETSFYCYAKSSGVANEMWKIDESDFDRILIRAKQTEKEEIIEFAEQYNTYLLKCKKGIRGSVVEMSAEQYYNETFKK